MKARRLGAAWLFVSARASVGSMASRNGKATAVPKPFKTVRRGEKPFLRHSFLASTFLEWIAFDDFDHQGGKPIAFFGQVVGNLGNGGLIIKFQAPTKRIC